MKRKVIRARLYASTIQVGTRNIRIQTVEFIDYAFISIADVWLMRGFCELIKCKRDSND